MSRLLRAAMILVMATAMGCTYYTTAIRNDAENIIHAPLDVVWETTLEVLRYEAATLDIVKRSENIILGETRYYGCTDKNDIAIKFIPQGEKKTILHLQVKGQSQTLGFDYQKYLAEYFFNKIKQGSEMSPSRG